MNQYENFQFKLKLPNSWLLRDWEAHRILITQMHWWCTKQCSDVWGLDRGGEDVVFWFVNEQDYALFLLRWS